MDYTKSKGLELVPRKFPPPELLTSLHGDLSFEETIKTLPEPLQRALLWSVALDAAFWSTETWRKIPAFQGLSVGFADPDFEGDAFALLAYVPPFVKRSPGWIEIEGLKFPLFSRPSYVEYHAPPQVHPAEGTAACWARSGRAGVKGELGLLTAKHVVAGSPTGGIATTQGPGRILDLGPEGIDAALIGVPAKLQPRPGKAMAPVPHLAPWTDVTVRGRSGARASKIVEVQSARGGLDPNIPLRFFISHPGQPGDSGALVIDGQGRAVGLYMGQIVNTATMHAEGLCQHLAQAAHAMDLELFE